MKFLKKLLGKNETDAPQPSSSKEGEPIRVFDSYGRELLIPRNEWFKVLIDNLQKAWNSPDELSSHVIQGLQDGFDAEMEDAAKQLQRIDPDKERGSTLLAVVYLQTKSLKISGGSLAREVDIVPANWFNTNKYAETNQKIYRGVHILNYPEKKREKDTPFIHGALLAHRDDQFNRNVRRLVRLCKSIKYDSGRKDMPSSYDLESLIYRMPDDLLRWERGQELQLTESCHRWLGALIDDSTLRDSLYVPDGKRKIFAPEKATVQEIQGLHDELGKLLRDVVQGLSRSFRKLAEARVQYPQF